MRGECWMGRLGEVEVKREIWGDMLEKARGWYSGMCFVCRYIVKICEDGKRQFITSYWPPDELTQVRSHRQSQGETINNRKKTSKHQSFSLRRSQPRKSFLDYPQEIRQQVLFSRVRRRHSKGQSLEEREFRLTSLLIHQICLKERKMLKSCAYVQF